MNSSTTMSSAATRPLRPSFRGIVYGELMKISWLRITWVMTVFTVSAMALFFLILLLEPYQTQTLRQNPVDYGYSVFLGQNMLVFRVLTGFFMMILTVYCIGLEYQQGTIRILLGRGVGRVQLLLGKLVALFLIALFIQIAGIILNLLLLAVIIGISTGSVQAFGIIFTGVPIGQFFLYSLLNMWVSILLAAMMTTLGRSLTVGLTVSLLWFPLDNIASIILALASQLLPGNILPEVTAYLLGPNLNAWPAVVFSKRITSEFIPAVPVSGPHILITTLVYAIAFIIVTVALVRARDVRA